MPSLTSWVFILAATTLAVDQYIHPESVPLTHRNAWCESQTTQCPLLCLQYPGNNAATIANTCDPLTLQYSCVCAVNNMSPNASEYSLTLPYFICTEANNQCVAKCGRDNLCADKCRTDHPCGAQNPTRVNITSLTSALPSTMMSIPTGTEMSNPTIFSGFGGAAATQTASVTARKTVGSSSSVREINQMWCYTALFISCLLTFGIFL